MRLLEGIKPYSRSLRVMESQNHREIEELMFLITIMILPKLHDMFINFSYVHFYYVEKEFVLFVTFCNRKLNQIFAEKHWKSLFSSHFNLKCL